MAYVGIVGIFYLSISVKFLPPLFLLKSFFLNQWLLPFWWCLVFCWDYQHGDASGYRCGKISTHPPFLLKRFTQTEKLSCCHLSITTDTISFRAISQKLNWIWTNYGYGLKELKMYMRFAPSNLIFNAVFVKICPFEWKSTNAV